MSLLTYFIEYNRYMNILGIGVILLIAILFSQKRSKINYALVFKALLLQFAIAVLVLKTSMGQAVVASIAYGVGKMYTFADQGAGFVFGNLSNTDMPWGFIFAIKVLPVIIFFGAFTALLFHWGIIQLLVSGINSIIRPLLGTSGAETLCASANSFLGQTEAPLLVRNYLKDMTKSEMLVVMVSGMATISGSILVVFGVMGVPVHHMLAASVMAIPASILIAKILLPETERPATLEHAAVEKTGRSGNALGAIAAGTTDGLSLAVNVAAMLIAFLALLAMINHGVSYLADIINSGLSYAGFGARLPQGLGVDTIFGYLFAPFGYLLGFTDGAALAAGQLIGTKVAVNELIAYGQMVKMGLSERAMNIITYALCGFSNFSCIGIQIGGIGALVPEKREWLTQLGLYAVLGGALANLLSAMIAGLLL
ncbi:MAG: nucleoside transporter C-terminal domain-containing protein [Candidatus Babeliales bacterium]|nr:nucleoside transporter C-terminal domain-containing protein [Candidatus Babeliales bacterium]